MNTYALVNQANFEIFCLYYADEPRPLYVQGNKTYFSARFIASDAGYCWIHQVDGEWIAEDYPVVEE